MTRFALLCVLAFLVVPVLAFGQAAPPAISAPAPIAPPAPAVPAIPQPPEWVSRQTPAEQKWVNDVLSYWEARSNKIKIFECKFERWDYDPIFGPKTEAKTYAEGVIKYAQPDKGLFQVEKLFAYAPPTQAGQKNYVEQDASFGEHWICDGKVIYAFEAPKKQLTVTPLPPEMQGQAIADGPLPFMFGARAETIKARYWLHEMPEGMKPEGSKGKYCLEAIPKSRQDAQNFGQVRIILDGKEFLPEIIEVYAPNANQQNPSRQTFRFSERKTTDEAALAGLIASALDPLKIFHRNFHEPKTPAGWKKVILNDNIAAAAGPPPQNQPAPPKAR